MPCPMHPCHLAVTDLGNITNNETNWHHVPPDEIHRQGHSITNVIFLTKMHKLKLTLKKNQVSPNSQTQNQSTILTKNTNATKDKG